MASSSSSPIPVNGDEVRHCDCGFLMKCRVSWTTINPGRRFLTCPNSLGSGHKCNAFRWIDPELPNDWYKSSMIDMHTSLMENGSHVASGGINYKQKLQELQQEFELYKMQTENQFLRMQLEMKEQKLNCSYFSKVVFVVMLAVFVLYLLAG